MNHIIEKGIELVHQDKTGSHDCDASRTLAIQEQMIQSGYIFFDKRFIEEFVQTVMRGDVLNWLRSYQQTSHAAANPLLTMIDRDLTTFNHLLEYLQLESDYFKLYTIAFFSEEDNIITVKPVFFPQHPEITAAVLFRTLEFLEVGFGATLQEDQISIAFHPTPSKTDKEQRDKQVEERFKELWAELNPLGHLWHEEVSADPGQTLADFQKQVLTQIKTLELQAWEEGLFRVGQSRVLVVPEKGIKELVGTDQDTWLSKLPRLSKLMFEPLLARKWTGREMDSFMAQLVGQFQRWGLGRLTYQGDKNPELQVRDSVLAPEMAQPFLNPILEVINLEITTPPQIMSENSYILSLEREKKKVLIVDDEQDVLDALKREVRRLRDLQISIKTTTSPKTALRVLKTEKIHVIVADQRMKQTTGVELLEEVYRDHPDVRRVLITGYGDADVMQEAINRAHVHFFLKKPWDVENLRRALAFDGTAGGSESQ